jgi:hypothetical protein
MLKGLQLRKSEVEETGGQLIKSMIAACLIRVISNNEVEGVPALNVAIINVKK